MPYKINPTTGEQDYYEEVGEKGDPGATGAGVVVGGTTGQILAKKTNTDYDTEWVNPYSLPIASTTVLGGIKVGTRLSILDGVLSADATDLSAYSTKLQADALYAPITITQYTDAMAVSAVGTPWTSAGYYIGDGSAFASSAHNHDLAYLGISAKASDSDLLDGHDTAYFQTALGFTPENSANKGQANGYVPLGANSTIASTYLPPIAIIKPFAVSSQAEQLALTSEEGDVAIRSDLNKSYIRNSGTTGTMTDWYELLTPTDTVLSVDGQTGAVDLSSVYLPIGHTSTYNHANYDTAYGWGNHASAGYAPLVSPSFATPTLGVATATSLGLGGDLSGSAYLSMPSLTTNTQVKIGSFEIQGYTLNNGSFLDNAYYTTVGGAGYRYRETGYANAVNFLNGAIKLRYAPSGTAGDVFTFTDGFTLKNDGHLIMEGVTTTGATGTGKLVFDTSPTLATPTLGVATATRIGAGVAADANRVFVSAATLATALPLFERTGATTNDAIACNYFLSTKTTDMGDGFGVTNAFQIKDDAGVANTIGTIGFVRAGADNTGDFVVRPYTAGTATERFRVTSAGQTIATSLTVGTTDLVGVANFHGSVASHDSFFGGAYGNTLNFDSEANADTGAGYVNFYGYQGGQTKFRDFHIANGKGGTIAFFDGSSGYAGIGAAAARVRLDVKNSAATGAAAPNAAYDVIVQENNDVCYYNMITPADKRSGFIFSDDNRGYGGLFYTHGDASFGVGTEDSIVFFAGNAVRGYINATSLLLKVGLNVEGNTTLGNASTDTITMTGRAIFRTAASDPQHATAGSRPAGSVGEIVYYSGKMYFCTNASTPTWEKITSA